MKNTFVVPRWPQLYEIRFLPWSWVKLDELAQIKGKGMEPEAMWNHFFSLTNGGEFLTISDGKVMLRVDKDGRTYDSDRRRYAFGNQTAFREYLRKGRLFVPAGWAKRVVNEPTISLQGFEVAGKKITGVLWEILEITISPKESSTRIWATVFKSTMTHQSHGPKAGIWVHCWHGGTHLRLIEWSVRFSWRKDRLFGDSPDKGCEHIQEFLRDIGYHRDLVAENDAVAYFDFLDSLEANVTSWE